MADFAVFWRLLSVNIRHLRLLKVWFRSYSEEPFSNVGAPNRKKVPPKGLPHHGSRFAQLPSLRSASMVLRGILMKALRSCCFRSQGQKLVCVRAACCMHIGFWPAGRGSEFIRDRLRSSRRSVNANLADLAVCANLGPLRDPSRASALLQGF